MLASEVDKHWLNSQLSALREPRPVRLGQSS